MRGGKMAGSAWGCIEDFVVEQGWTAGAVRAREACARRTTGQEPGTPPEQVINLRRDASLTGEGLLAQHEGHVAQEILGGAEVLDGGLVGGVDGHDQVGHGIEVVLVAGGKTHTVSDL